MTLKIVRDKQGRVTITDLASGRSEVATAIVSGRETEVTLRPSTALPSHSWSAG